MDNEVLIEEQGKLTNTYNKTTAIISNLKKKTELPDYLKMDNYTNNDERPFIVSERERFYNANKWIYQNIQKYEEISKEVYFSRIDLKDNDGIETYYISKIGSEKIGTIDWRSEIGGLFYNNTISEYEGKSIFLKRAFKIRYDKLLECKEQKYNIKDITDAFLMDVLKEKKNDKYISDIIRSIQKEQNSIIRLPLNFNKVILGCAGSGKTMIMLHNLSYLKFNNDISWDKVAIITPNNDFKKTFLPLKNQLDIKEVRMLTLDEYFYEKLKQYDPLYFNEEYKLVSDYSLNQVEILDKFYSNEMTDYIFKHYSELINSTYLEIENFKLEKYGEQSTLRTKYKFTYENVNFLLSSMKRKVEDINKYLFDKYEKDISFIIDNLNSLFDIEEFVNIVKLNKVDNYEWLDSLEKMIEVLNPQFKESIKFFSFDIEKVYFLIRENLNVENNKKKIAKLKLENNQLKEKLLKENSKINYLNIQLDGLYEKRSKIRFYQFKEKSSLNKCIKDTVLEIKNLEINIKRINDKLTLINKEIVYFNNILSNIVNLNDEVCNIYIEVYNTLKKIVKEKELLDDLEYSKNFGRKLKYIRNIKLWFNNTIVPEFNCILKENNKQQIDDMHKYNFYFYHLLQLYSTYRDNLIKSDLLVCVDEFQDISPKEIELIREVNKRCTINLYGDLSQRLLSKGYKSKKELPKDCHEFLLNNNYRNTIEITNFYNDKLNKTDNPVGISGPSVREIDYEQLFQYEIDENSVVICNSNLMRKIKRLFQGINIINVEDSKGLEFNKVFVFEEGMNTNEKYIAYSRALNELIIVKTKKDVVY